MGGPTGRWVSPCSVVFRGVVGVLGRLQWLASSLEYAARCCWRRWASWRGTALRGTALRCSGAYQAAQRLASSHPVACPASCTPAAARNRPTPTAPIPQPRLARAGLAPPALIDPNSLQTAAKCRRRGTGGRTRGGPARCFAGGLPRSLQPLTPTRDLLAAHRDRRETPQRRLLAQRRRRCRCGGGLATMQQEQEQEEQPAAAAAQQQPAVTAE